MTFYYDMNGWLTDEVLPDRCTDVVPPPPDGDLKPNFTGHAWVLQRYVAPSEADVARTRDEAKARRQALVDGIVVTANGKAFDGDETSQDRMARAITVATLTGQDTCTWVLHDNVAVTVTRGELATALALAMAAQAAVWVIPTEI